MSNFPIGDVRLRFFLSRDRVITTDDYQMGDRLVMEDVPSRVHQRVRLPYGSPDWNPERHVLRGRDRHDQRLRRRHDDANNATFFPRSIVVRSRVSPFIDRIDAVTAVGKAFKLKMFGGDLQSGMRVFLGGNAFEWTNTRFKHNGLFVIKGGEALMKWFPEGVEVPIRLVNPDGGETFATFTR